MTAAATATQGIDGPPPPGRINPAEAEMSTRGRTVPEQVVEKSAAQAALEVNHVHG